MYKKLAFLFLILTLPFSAMSLELLKLDSEPKEISVEQKIKIDNEVQDKLICVGEITEKSGYRTLLNKHLIDVLSSIVISYVGNAEDQSYPRIDEKFPTNIQELDNGFLIITSCGMLHNSQSCGHSVSETTIWKPNNKTYDYSYTFPKDWMVKILKNDLLATHDYKQCNLNICSIDENGKPTILQQLECPPCGGIIELQNGYFYLHYGKNIKVYKKDKTNKLNLVNTFTIDASFKTLLELQNGLVALIAYYSNNYGRDSNEKIVILDTNSNKIIQKLEYYETCSYGVRIKDLIKLKNGSLIYFFDNHEISKNIKIWVPSKGGSYTYLQDLIGHTEQVNKVVELENGSLASCSGDNTIKIWKINKNGNECVQTLFGHTGKFGIYSIKQLKNGCIASCSSKNDNTIKIWALNKNNLYELVQNITDHKGSIFGIKELKNGNLISNSTDGSAKIWKLNTKKEVTEYFV